MDTKLIEITKLLKSPSQLKAKSGKPVQNSVWNDEEKLATVKAPPQNSVLVIKKSITNEQNVEIQDQVRQIMIQNNIPVTQSLMNKSGDMVMVCETQDDRDKMKNLMSNSNQEIVMNAPCRETSVDYHCWSKEGTWKGGNHSNARTAECVHKTVCQLK